MAKRSVTRKVLLAILFVAALVAGIGASLYHRLDASIDVHRGEIRALLEDVPVRHSTRLALASPEEPGNVWDLLTPAFDALWSLHDVYSSNKDLWPGMEPDFNAHGIPAGTPKLLEDGAAALEACRRSMRRSRLDYAGPLDPLLPEKAARAARALCSKGFLLWQEGRDVEAMDWLFAALSVSYDAARLGQHRTWEVLRVTETWVCEDAVFLLSESALSPQELGECERRLELLRSQRPPLSAAFRVRGAEVRHLFLEDCAQKADAATQDYATSGPVIAGWRDLYSSKVFMARMLTGLRTAFEDAERLPWTSATDIVERWNRLSLSLRQDLQEWFRLGPDTEVASLVRMEVFRIALACARFRAAKGRMPLAIGETGCTPDLGPRPLILNGDTLSVPGSAQEDWKIGRR